MNRFTRRKNDERCREIHWGVLLEAEREEDALRQQDLEEARHQLRPRPEYYYGEVTNLDPEENMNEGQLEFWGYR